MTEVPCRVLFVCIHNSARSQMAEAFLERHGKNKFLPASAGLEPGMMNPNVVKVMQEIGLDLGKKETKSVFDIIGQGKLFHVVITVCDAASAERCPVFPGTGKQIAWSFSDPSAFQGSPEEVMDQTRLVRDEIEKKIIEFVRDAGV